MSVTDIPVPHVDESRGQSRAEFMRDLIDVWAFYVSHDKVPLPGKDERVVYLPIYVPAGARGARIEELERIAEAMGVPVIERDGCLVAERPFGHVVLIASLQTERYLPALLAKADARRAEAIRRAGMGVPATQSGSAA